MIIRRHKCEVQKEQCLNIYVCDKCSDWSERKAVPERGKRNSQIGNPRHMGSRMLISPECLQKFVCPNCEERNLEEQIS